VTLPFQKFKFEVNEYLTLISKFAPLFKKKQIRPILQDNAHNGNAELSEG